MNAYDETATRDAARDAPRRESAMESLLGLATSAVERFAAERKDRLADVVIDLAAGVRRSGRRFEGDQDWLADAIDKGAGMVRDLAEDVRQADVRDLAAQGRDMVRNRPALFAAGTILAGVIATIAAQRALADFRAGSARPA